MNSDVGEAPAQSFLNWTLGVLSTVLMAVAGFGFMRLGKIEEKVNKAVVDGREARDKLRDEWTALVNVRHSESLSQIQSARIETGGDVRRIWEEINTFNKQLSQMALAAEQRFATKDDILRLERKQQEAKEDIQDTTEQLLDRLQENLKLLIDNRAPIKGGD